MMTLSRISHLDHRSMGTLPGLRISAYERAASWLLAWLLLTTVVALCLFVVWLGMHGMSPVYHATSINLQRMNGAGGQDEIGQDLSLASPSTDEVASETDLSEPGFESLLKTAIDAAAVHQAQLGEEALFDDEPRGRSKTKGTGSAADGGEGNGPLGVPPHLRWEIDWGGADTLDTYARKLDFFGIELGAYGVPGPGQVTYVSQLSRPHPHIRVGASKADSRLYMSWRGGARKEADRGLAAKAGVSPITVLLQFFPPETEELLLRVEHAYGNRAAASIRKTRFGVRSAGKGYEFFVIEQGYRSSSQLVGRKGDDRSQDRRMSRRNNSGAALSQCITHPDAGLRTLPRPPALPRRPAIQCRMRFNRFVAIIVLNVDLHLESGYFHVLNRIRASSAPSACRPRAVRNDLA